MSTTTLYLSSIAFGSAKQRPQQMAEQYARLGSVIWGSYINCKEQLVTNRITEKSLVSSMKELLDGGCTIPNVDLVVVDHPMWGLALKNYSGPLVFDIIDNYTEFHELTNWKEQLKERTIELSEKASLITTTCKK